jgi:hypothetical protein
MAMAMQRYDVGHIARWSTSRARCIAPAAAMINEFE